MIRPAAPLEDSATNSEAPSPRPARAALSGSAPHEVGEEVPARTRIISPSLLLPAEVVIFELKPSLWYAVFRALPISAVGVAVVVLALAIRELGALRYPAVVVGVWVAGARGALAMLELWGRTYVLTDRRVLVQSGVFDVHVEALGLERIESTFVAQAVVQRALGIGTVFFLTGDSGAGSLSWDHIREPKKWHGYAVAQIERWKRTLSGGLPEP